MKYKGDLIITDPCYIIKDRDDWETSDYGNELENVGFSSYLTVPTGFGDCCGDVFESEISVIDGILSDDTLSFHDLLQAVSDKCKMIGKFGVDSGQYGVYNHDDIDKINSDKRSDWWDKIVGNCFDKLATAIKDFDGDIECVTRTTGSSTPDPQLDFGDGEFVFTVNMLVLRDKDRAFIAIPGL